MVLVLSCQQVTDVINIRDLIGGVKDALIGLSKGQSINPNRLRIFVEQERSMLACMAAYLADEGVLGAKIVGSSDKPVPPGQPRNVSSIVVLLDSQGKFLSIMSGSQLGPMRTAATSAVATGCLARADASSIAMIGCGVQARLELQGAAIVRPLKQVYAYDVSRDVAERFAAEMQQRLGLRVTVAKSAEEAVERADIVTLATTSSEPVVADSAIRAGTHINAVGAHTPRKRELASDTVVRARLFAEYRQAILNEAGDVLIPIEEGRVSQAHILGEIGEVAGGMVQGRLSPDDVTIFKSTGIAVEDVVAAKIVYERAMAKGIGYRVEL